EHGRVKMRLVLLIAAAFGFFCASAAFAQERTLDEIKAEALKRAENGMYPLIGLDPADVKEAFASIKSSDYDDWAAAFIKVGDRYMAEAKSLETSDPAKANADYIRAWRIYSFGRWPVPASPGKQRAYTKALEAFLAHAKFMDPPLEVVRIPFEGSEIVGYLRLPKNAKGPVPVVIAISGLDSRKEDLSENFGAVVPHGIGFIGIDSPGTGQSPVKASETAEREFSRVIDYLETRREVDKTRIGVDGQSFGAYWATKLAIVEHARLKAVVAQSPPVDATFAHDFVVNKTLGNREYLFGLGPALMSIFQKVDSVDALAVALGNLSLVRQGLLGKPTAPMLIISGALDTQVPISDTYLLLSSGDVPKEAWINPQGGHLGRQVRVWPDPVIFREVIIPWLERKLAEGNK
ncbi:MAG TPA: alpha/beta hydrolase, partial [Candidatus Acidoferrum sp.]|nr:alpha/beta hydrolase [Candidatus Acidoferrum sp.]